VALVAYITPRQDASRRPPTQEQIANFALAATPLMAVAIAYLSSFAH